jgi:hypothetical protein
MANQRLSKRRHFSVLLSRGVLDRHVATFDEAAFAQPLMEGTDHLGSRIFQDTDDRHRWLLSALQAATRPPRRREA